MVLGMSFVLFLLSRCASSCLLATTILLRKQSVLSLAVHCKPFSVRFHAGAAMC